MSKKKVTKKQGAKSTTATLVKRALAIVNASGNYDKDTRRAVELSLEDLRETVRRAEGGELICDTTDPEIKDPPPTLAEMISAALRHPDTPISVRDGIFGGLSNYSFDDTDPCYIRMVIEAAKKEGRKHQQKGGE